MPLTLPFGAAETPPAVRVPVLEATVGALVPDDLRERLVALSVELNLVPGVDVVDARLSTVAGAAVPGPGDSVELSAGFVDGGATRVFTGAVESVAPFLDGTVRITAVNGGAVLAGLRVERTFESSSAGGVVRELLGEAGVEEGSVEDGPSLPFYAVDAGRSALAWVERLAAASGFRAFVDGEGAFHFGSPGGAPVAGFTYGSDLMAASVRSAKPAVSGVTVVGEGAAGSEGREAWGWLLKDPSPVTGGAGDAPGSRVVSDPSLRTAEAASAAARARVDRSGRAARTGELLVAGAPDVTPGSSVQVADTPGGTLDGTYRVLGVRHRIGGHDALVSRLFVTGPEDGGGPLGGIGSGGLP